MNSDFSTNLRMEMARQRLTQSALARAMGTRQSTVCGWLNGRQPETATLERLLERLNVPREALFDRPGHLGGSGFRQSDTPRMNAEKIKAVMPRGCKELLLVDYMARDLEETKTYLDNLQARLDALEAATYEPLKAAEAPVEFKPKPKPKK